MRSCIIIKFIWTDKDRLTNQYCYSRAISPKIQYLLQKWCIELYYKVPIYSMFHISVEKNGTAPFTCVFTQRNTTEVHMT